VRKQLETIFSQFNKIKFIEKWWNNTKLHKKSNSSLMKTTIVKQQEEEEKHPDFSRQRDKNHRDNHQDETHP
jgi:hypothetical protein